MTVLEKLYTKTSRQARYARGGISQFTGSYKNYFNNARGSRIMAYHGICEADPLKFNTLFITRRTFEEHLKFYSEYFNVISLDDFYVQRFSTNKFNISLTFDDGFANNYHYVLPLLEKYRIPATFFITGISAAGYDILWNDMLTIASRFGPDTLLFGGQMYHKNNHFKYIDEDGIRIDDKFRTVGFGEKSKLIHILDKLIPIRRNRLYEEYWRQMNVEQIRSISASPFVHIGAHGYYHNDLAGIPLTGAATELAQTAGYLQNITNKQVYSVAFPYGSYNAGVVQAAKAAGYTQLLATAFNTPADGEEQCMKERLIINPYVSTLNQMYATIRGYY